MKLQLFQDDAIVQLTALVNDCFAGKTDKGGYPYIVHCITVAQYSADLAAKYYSQDNESIQRYAYIVGLCHDCYEDLDDQRVVILNKLIEKLFPSRALDIGHWINLLTRRHDQSYDDYEFRLTKSKLATIVKAADTHHNSLSERYRYLFDKMTSTQIDRVTAQCVMYNERHERLIALLDKSKSEVVFTEA